jgi:hypothetical protein
MSSRSIPSCIVTNRARRRAAFALLPLALALSACATDQHSVGMDEMPLEDTSSSEAPCGDGVISRNVHATEQSELEALAGCGEVSGDLWIARRPDLDLHPLSSLRIVRGNLILGLSEDTVSTFDSLEGLEALEQVSSLQIHGLTGDLTPLRSLSRVVLDPSNGWGDGGYIEIANCDGLTDLRGLENLVEWNQLRLLGNDALESLDGLRAPRVSENQILAEDAPNLRDLSALAHVTNMRALRLWRTGVESFEGFRMQYLRSLDLRENPELSSLSGLNGLWSVANLTLFRNPKLERLPEPIALSGLETMQIIGNAELRSVPAYSGGPGGRILVGGDAFPMTGDTSSFESGFLLVDIGDNAKLSSVALPTSFAVGRYVSVFDNPSLTAVDLSPLQRVDMLNVSGNAALNDLDVSALATVDELVVIDNPLLATSSLENVKTFASTVSGNLAESAP